MNLLQKFKPQGVLESPSLKVFGEDLEKSLKKLPFEVDAEIYNSGFENNFINRPEKIEGFKNN